MVAKHGSGWSRRVRAFRRAVTGLAIVAMTTVSLPSVASAQTTVKVDSCEYAPGTHAPCPKVQEDPAITGKHSHGKRAVYWISTTIPSGWRASVKEAAKAWTDRTTYTYAYKGLTSSTDWTNLSTHIVWRGTIPNEWSGCQPSKNFYGCARTRLKSDGLHLRDADIVLNKNKSFGTSTTACILSKYDVQTAMVHEFGHWGKLSHSNAPRESTVMNSEYDGCERTPTAYDQELMEHNFLKGGHTTS